MNKISLITLRCRAYHDLKTHKLTREPTDLLMHMTGKEFVATDEKLRQLDEGLIGYDVLGSMDFDDFVALAKRQTRQVPDEELFRAYQEEQEELLANQL